MKILNMIILTHELINVLHCYSSKVIYGPNSGEKCFKKFLKV